MCGRYTQLMSWQELYERYQGFLDGPDRRLNLEPRYNAAPTQPMPVIRRAEQGGEIAILMWWLVPSWAKDDKPAYNTFNARGEEIATKAAFREPFRRRRCLVPASGFYEWQEPPADLLGDRPGGKGAPKRPYYFMLADGEPMTFAGLWDRWEKGERPLESFTIVTTVANPLVAEIHAKKRMPVILEPEDWGTWLSGTPEAAQALIRSYPAEAMRRHAVSTRVNASWDRTRKQPIDHPGLIAPVAA